VFHEFQDLRNPMSSGFCACSYVSALLRLVVVLGTALRRFLHNDNDVDSRAKANSEKGTGCFVIHIFVQILDCCTHTFSNVSAFYIHTSIRKISLAMITRQKFSSNSNSHNNVYGAVITAVQCHCESSPGSTDECSTQH